MNTDLINYKPEKTNYKNVVGIGCSYKIKNNIQTNEEVVLYCVSKKESLDKLDKDDIVPSKVIINGVEYNTDVQEIGEISAMSSLPPIDYTDPYYDFRWKELPNDTVFNPMIGGVAISQVLGSNAGTLAILCKDNDTGGLCLLSNHHVLTIDLLNISERYTTDAIRGMNLYISLIDSYRHVVARNYKALYMSKNTDIITKGDCAIAALNGKYVDLIESRKQHGLSMPQVYKFATTEEINSLNPLMYLYSSGQTTGGKGELGFSDDGREKRTKLVFQSFLNFITISYDRGVRNPDYHFLSKIGPVFQYKAFDVSTNQFKEYGSILPGDSGSAVFARFGTEETGYEYKIVGLAFAGTKDTGYDAYACRIDEVCAALNISEWPEDELIPGQGEIPQFFDIDNPEYYDSPGLDPEPFKIIDGKKYWCIGTIRK